MRTLAEINAERKELIYEAIGKIVDRKEIGKRYTTAQLSEMCDGLVPPEIFKRICSRADYQAFLDRRNERGARVWKMECTQLFGAWNLTFKPYLVYRNYTVKWFDEDGRVVRTTERIGHDYEVEFVLN